MPAPDGEDIGKHPHAVADAIDRAAAVIAAPYRQLVDPESILPRQIQRFHIKAESIALGDAEDRLRCPRGEALESALRVRDARDRDAPARRG